MTDQRPDDLSTEASAKRQQVFGTKCGDKPFPEEWEHPRLVSATLEYKCSKLATVTGRDANFAHSLAEQFAKNGKLSAKQEKWVHRLYSEYWEHRYWSIKGEFTHDWQKVGSITHSYNYMLNTYCYTDYFKCTKCGEWAEKFVNKNYSGD